MRDHHLNATLLAEALVLSPGREATHRKLAQALRQAVLDGRLPLGARLPSERDLAAALRLSRTTVTAAYTTLRDEGFVVTRHGTRGTITLPRHATPVNTPLVAADRGGEMFDLAYAALSAPPVALRGAYEVALQVLPAHLSSHGYAPTGLPELRARIAARFAARGLPTTPEQIVVTFGAQHALHLLLRALVAPGDRVLVDQPTYPHALDALRGAGCRVVPVALTDEGWDAEGVALAMRQIAPRLAYLIPDYHNPTGHLMPYTQRALVALAAARTRTTLIVDETLVELTLDGDKPPPLASVDDRANVVTIGSASKVFWGGLRVGWIRASREVVDRVMTARAAVDLGVPLVEQLATSILLENAEDVLTARRTVLRTQRDVVAAFLREQLPEWSFSLPRGGLSVWASLPAPVGSALCARAEGYGVRLTSGARFGADGLFERQLRLPFTLPEAELREALKRLSLAYRTLPVEGRIARNHTEFGIV
ncbi:PLP-dependent aminotransferase family protein [Deinococcus yavapaiensis]|uniref:GntR family transcriptional regulator n=1 Tax=Deinococcus yavapaiensis KR-236 TaxID=694435 RepID=A0A318S6T7_9DEIO|nr:PLP-dependent aminotransferase family protein [Deinococcus yavapaiensis]PYE50550.1 GntR family transcriptional regulator [Deinococcus yavapaiensis KR-236]